MILVAGGSGRLGSLVVMQLAAAGQPVRVLTRDPRRANHLADIPGVSVITGDIRNPASIRQAVDACTVVVSAVQGLAGPGGVSPATVDRDGNKHLVDVAASAGACCVLMSVVGAAADSPMELFRMKYEAEKYASAVGLPLTVIRSTAFTELWAEILLKTAGRGGRPLVFGRGRSPINFVSVGDVAALVMRVLIDVRLRGQTYEVGGPDNLTMVDFAQRLSGGRRPRQVGPTALSIAAATVGRVRPALGRQMRAALAMDRVDLAFDANPLHSSVPDLPCTTVDEVLNRIVPGRETARG